MIVSGAFVEIRTINPIALRYTARGGVSALIYGMIQFKIHSSSGFFEEEIKNNSSK
jgi:hypothetical protein